MTIFSICYNDSRESRKNPNAHFYLRR